METIQSNNWMRDTVYAILDNPANEHKSMQEVVNELTIAHIKYGIRCITQLQVKGNPEELIEALQKQIEVLESK